jgi:hypothetical protein
MKRKKNDSDQRNVWKIVSIVFIVLFVLILIWGIANVRSRNPFTELNQGQIDMAKKVVAEDLESIGDSIDNYEVYVTNRPVGFIDRPQGNGRPGNPIMFPDKDNNLSNVQVSLRGNSSGYLYIIDMGSEKVLMRSFTEWFNG